MSYVSDWLHGLWKDREARRYERQRAVANEPPVARAVCVSCSGRGKVACVFCMLCTRKESESCTRCHGSRFVACPRCLTRFKTRAGRALEVVDTNSEAP